MGSHFTNKFTGIYFTPTTPQPTEKLHLCSLRHHKLHHHEKITQVRGYAFSLSMRSHKIKPNPNILESHQNKLGK